MWGFDMEWVVKGLKVGSGKWSEQDGDQEAKALHRCREVDLRAECRYEIAAASGGWLPERDLLVWRPWSRMISTASTSNHKA